MFTLKATRLACFLVILGLSGVRVLAEPDVCAYDCALSCSQKLGTLDGECVLPETEECENWDGCESTGPGLIGCNRFLPECAIICFCDDACDPE